MNIDQFRGMLARMAYDCGSQKSLALRFGVSEAFVSDVIHGRRDPGTKILKNLGYEWYLRKVRGRTRHGGSKHV